MINNFEVIKEILEPLQVNEFYFIQVYQRRKENSDLSKNSKWIRSYYVNNLDEVKDSIIKTCHLYNARAYIRIDKRSWMKVGLLMAIDIARLMLEKEFKLYKTLDSCVSDKKAVCGNKYWLIDIDSEVPEELFVYMSLKANAKVIKTLNGHHLICDKIDRGLLRQYMTDYLQILKIENCKFEIIESPNTLLYF